MIAQTADQTISYSNSFTLSTEEIKNPKSELGGFDLSLSLVNEILIFVGVLDIFQDAAVFIWSLFEDGSSHTGLAFITGAVLLVDLFQIYVPFFNAPLGIQSVALEKNVLTAIGILDIVYDLALIAIHVAVGIFNSLDTLLILSVIGGTFVLSSNIFGLYYTTFDYEKDHGEDYEEERYFKFEI